MKSLIEQALAIKAEQDVRDKKLLDIRALSNDLVSNPLKADLLEFIRALRVILKEVR